MIKSVEFKLNGIQYNVVPNFQVIAMWEDKIDVDWMRQRIIEGKAFPMKDAAYLIYCAVWHGQDDKSKRLDYNEIGDWLVENQREGGRVSAELILNALTAGSEEARPKKQKPTAEQSKSESKE